MSTILIYGDSNTWGQDAYLQRYQEAVRWVAQLGQKLGPNYRVVPAGLSGRVAGNSSAIVPIKRGKDSFELVYRQTFPVDVVIIALGTNDIKEKYNISAATIVDDLLWYKQKVEHLTDYTGKPLRPKVLYIAPPNCICGTVHFAGDEAKRRAIITGLQANNVDMVTAEDIDLSEDGVHFSPKGHIRRAEIVYDKLKEMKL